MFVEDEKLVEFVALALLYLLTFLNLIRSSVSREDSCSLLSSTASLCVQLEQLCAWTRVSEKYAIKSKVKYKVHNRVKLFLNHL